MKKNYLLIVTALTCFLGNVNAQSPNWLWAKGMGGTSGDGGNSIALDASGNVYTTGSFTGTVDFDPGAGVFNLISVGSSDIFITKSDASGNFIWAKAMGGTSGDGGNSIAIDPAGSGDVYITGFFRVTVDFDPGAGIFNLTSVGNEDIFISKLDSSGNFVWAKAIGGTYYDYGQSIALDVSGNVYTTGNFWGPADFDPGPGTFNLLGFYKIFVSKLDSSGNFVWAKALCSGGANSEGLSIAIDLAGNQNVYTTGWFNQTGDFDPGPGTFNLTAIFHEDMFISKLDSLGNFVWAKAMSGIDYEEGHSITLDPSGSGDVYTTGFFQGTVDFDPGAGVFNLTGGGGFISKLDSSGNFVWAKAIGGNGNSMALDPAGNGALYTTGYFGGTVDFDPGAGVFNLTSSGGIDIFISKLDSAGNFVWAKAAGGTTNDRGNSVTFDASGHVHVTGSFSSPSIAFGSTTLTNAGGNDIFIAKLDTMTIITGNKDAVNVGNGILVFPNPAERELIIDNGELKIESVEVFDVLGQKIKDLTPSPSPSGEGSASIDVSKLAPGIYFVKVRTEKEERVAKFVKQ